MNFGDPDKDIGKAQARKLLVDFLNKVIRLGLHRASELCDRIDLSPHDPKQILKEVNFPFATKFSVQNLCVYCIHITPLSSGLQWEQIFTLEPSIFFLFTSLFP